MNDANFYKIIKDICVEKEIKVEVLSFGWILKLSKGTKTTYITDNFWDINTEASSYIAGDKYATYEVLKSAKIPVIEHKMVIREKVDKNDIKKYFAMHENKLVVKSNQGFEGKQVYLCETWEEVEKRINELLVEHRTISICPYYNIKTEYRTIYIDGECAITYAKIKSANSWKHNLSDGATAKIVEDEILLEKLHKMVRQIAQVINLKFCSIDIIQANTDKFYVIEVNSGVCMKNFMKKEVGMSIAKKIYQKAIDIQMGE